MKQWVYFILVCVVVGFFACSKDSDSSIPDTSSNINVFTAVPDQLYDIVVDTTTIGDGIGYGGSTGYHAFQAKRHNLWIINAQNRVDTPGRLQVSLRNNHSYSLFLAQNNNGVPQAIFVEDVYRPSTSGFGRIRYINLSDTYVNAATRLTLDVYMDTVRYFRRESFLATTDFVELAQGTYPIVIKYADSSKVLNGTDNILKVEDQKQYTIINYGNALKIDSFEVTTYAH